MTTLRLAILFARRQNLRDNRLAIALPVLAFAVVTAMLLIVLGGAVALMRLDSELSAIYQALTTVAIALLVIPMASLGAAAAKLSARRRDARLSSLALLGAAQSQIMGLTVIESAAGAFLGTLIGALLYAALVPLVGLIPMGGVALGSTLWLPWWWLPLVALAVAAVAAISAVIGLRNVRVTPLGVRTRQFARVPRKKRLLLAGILLVVAVLAMLAWIAIGQLTGPIGLIAALFVGFACGLLALDAVGPAYLSLRAKLSLRRADDVEHVLAARTILDDPHTAWRHVSGLALATFVSVIAAAGLGIVDLVQNHADTNAETILFRDMRTGVYLTLAIAFIMVAATVAISQAANTLDRAQIYVAMDRLGVPPSLVSRAARRSVMTAVTSVMVGAALLAVLLMLPLIGITLIARPVALAAIAVSLAIGVLLVRAAASVATQLVPGILAHPDRVL